MLHRYLDLISFHRKDTAFVIAVSGGAGAAEDFEAVCLETGRQRIHLLLTADAERDVRVSGAGGRLRLDGARGGRRTSLRDYRMTRASVAASVVGLGVLAAIAALF